MKCSRAPERLEVQESLGISKLKIREREDTV